MPRLPAAALPLLVLLALATPFSAARDAVDDTEAARLTAWFDAKFEEQLQQSPLRLTGLGRRDRQDEIDDFSDAASDAELAWMAATVEELRTEFDYASLPQHLKDSWDVWVRQYETERDAATFRRSGYLFNQMRGLHAALPRSLVNEHRVDTVADLEALIARYAAAGRAIDQVLLRARASADAGLRTPGFALQGVIDQSQRIVSGAPFTDDGTSALWADFEAKLAGIVEAGKLDAETAEALRSEARSALVERMKPAYDQLTNWAYREMERAPETNRGLAVRLDGPAYYAHLLRRFTTTELTADDIHEIGLSEVARIHEAMEAIMETVGFEGDLGEFGRMLRDSKDDPRFYHPNTDAGREAYLESVREALAGIESQLPEKFGLLPQAGVEVRRVESYRERDGGAAHYSRGTPDGSRPGIYYSHLSSMDAVAIYSMEAVAYHEALPGHHMQISIAQELEGLPKFRSHARFSVFSEGWGLYAESLAAEFEGTYEDPYSDFGRLTAELWRSIRLVVDTGLHAKGWTEEEAVAYALDNSAIPEGKVRSEIRRYIVMPGQATSYKMGMLKIMELRERAETSLGDDFDIRAFHDVILGGGALPLTILERRVDAWIAATRAS